MSSVVITEVEISSVTDVIYATNKLTEAIMTNLYITEKELKNTELCLVESIMGLTTADDKAGNDTYEYMLLCQKFEKINKVFWLAAAKRNTNLLPIIVSKWLTIASEKLEVMEIGVSNGYCSESHYLKQADRQKLNYETMNQTINSLSALAEYRNDYGL
jgi:hypothetical protein